MNDKNLGEDDFTNDIFSQHKYEAPIPSQKGKEDFLPWHRPRKQYVRQYQWKKEIINLLGKNSRKEKNFLNYLGLPGDDLLDIRYFHSTICTPYQLHLQFLGFNSSANPKNPKQADLNISLDEVKRLDRVRSQSDIVGDNFDQLANPNSIAFRRASELAPYDVINLDFCDGFGAKEAGKVKENYYNAITQLLSLQARNDSPWLLFLTTRVDKANIHETVLQKIIDRYCSNLRECAEFKDESCQRFSIDTAEAVKSLSGQPNSLLHIFVTGLCKWLIALALEQNPPTSVAVQSVCGYRVARDNKHEDLISLALKFVPTSIPVKDTMGLSGNTNRKLDEGKLATKALCKVAERVDVDLELRDNISIYRKMVDEMESLLKLARYDLQKYQAWLDSHYREFSETNI